MERRNANKGGEVRVATFRLRTGCKGMYAYRGMEQINNSVEIVLDVTRTWRDVIDHNFKLRIDASKFHVRKLPYRISHPRYRLDDTIEEMLQYLPTRPFYTVTIMKNTRPKRSYAESIVSGVDRHDDDDEDDEEEEEEEEAFRGDEDFELEIAEIPQNDADIQEVHFAAQAGGQRAEGLPNNYLQGDRARVVDWAFHCQQQRNLRQNEMDLDDDDAESLDSQEEEGASDHKQSLMENVQKMGNDQVNVLRGHLRDMKDNGKIERFRIKYSTEFMFFYNLFPELFGN